MSRAFALKRLGGYAITPVIDMADHAPAADSSAAVTYDQETQRVTMRATKQVWVCDTLTGLCGAGVLP